MLFHAIGTDRAGRVSLDIQSLRARFPTLSRLAYLNSGSYGLLSDAVEAAVRRYLDDRIARGDDWGGWMQRVEGVRGGMAGLLNAAPDEVAVTASASAGINAIASAIDFSGPRNRVLVSNLEFPTSAQIWHAQAPRGAVVEHVPEAEDGAIPLEHFERLIDERTALVAISQVCYRNGARVDVEGVVRLARARGALVLLDCFQAIGALTLDVTGLDLDFAVGGMLKVVNRAAPRFVTTERSRKAWLRLVSLLHRDGVTYEHRRLRDQPTYGRRGRWSRRSGGRACRLRVLFRQRIVVVGQDDHRRGRGTDSRPGGQFGAGDRPGRRCAGRRRRDPQRCRRHPGERGIVRRLLGRVHAPRLQGELGVRRRDPLPVPRQLVQPRRVRGQRPREPPVGPGCRGGRRQLDRARLSPCRRRSCSPPVPRSATCIR